MSGVIEDFDDELVFLFIFEEYKCMGFIGLIEYV